MNLNKAKDKHMNNTDRGTEREQRETNQKQTPQNHQ